MKITQTIAASFLFAAALLGSSAFASEVDGKSDNAWLIQTPISQTAVAKTQSAPTPTAAAAADKGTEQPAVQSRFNNAVVVP
jgi:hypothetical protein